MLVKFSGEKRVFFKKFDETFIYLAAFHSNVTFMPYNL
jgi:hypothetical protein